MRRRLLRSTREIIPSVDATHGWTRVKRKSKYEFLGILPIIENSVNDLTEPDFLCATIFLLIINVED